MNKQFETIINYIKSNVSFIFLENYEVYLSELLKVVHKSNIFDDIFYVGNDNNLSKDRNEVLTTDLNDINYLASQLIKYKSKDNVLIVATGFDYAFSEINDQNKAFIKLLYQIAVENMNASSKEGDDRRLTILFSGTNYTIPREIRDFSIKQKILYPSIEGINNLISEFKYKHLPTVNFAKQLKNNTLSNNLQGLSDKQIIQTLSILYLSFGPKLFQTQDIKTNIKIERKIKEIKKQQIEKSDIITIIDADVDLENNVKGLNNLRGYIYNQKKAFEYKLNLANYNITLPKGVLLLGKPGNGKSLSAKAIASTLELPLIKFDISKVLGQYVGQSESNMKETLATIQSMSPCVLWIDEIEKTFSGTNNKDNDVMRKVIGIFLTWMSDENKGVFVVATANNVKNQLPPELTRKGRFDKIFYIDNPNFKAKKEILKLHINKRISKLVDTNSSIFNSTSNNAIIDDIYSHLKNKEFSGAEIEHCCNEGIKTAIIKNLNIGQEKFEDSNFTKEVLENIREELNVMVPDSNQKNDNYNDLYEKLNSKYTEEIQYIDNYTNENNKSSDENNKPSDENGQYSLEDEFTNNLKNIINANINKEINSFISEKENKKTFENAD
ncbi:AAA family ATPase [Mammaliicoccus vitulinus]|uniref:AAA family ATPase n=1 Tax=Mammaliicoccus vitulinus TaxID=71237 RepID=UPI0002E06F0E|nr:AAA family ATPase [Mammaliicoccus vitulinus]MBO3077487.1 AAA family ATPase [Mammaliicoccus vitulinus]WQK88048.1 AAA family ATPase [Mammaliicoccus vitulinus]